jgi:hypothetical protein
MDALCRADCCWGRVLGATSAIAQSVRDDSAYRQEAAELHARVHALMQRGLQAETDVEQLSVAEEQLLLERRVHALSEDVEHADLVRRRAEHLGTKICY